MKIVIPGGSGHVGTLLAQAFHRDGHEVVVLSRAPNPVAWRVVRWDGRTAGAWCAELDGADAVVNLAGRSVDCRYGPRIRREIRESRIESTRAVAAAIAVAQTSPRVWLQMSTATIYAHRYDAANEETTRVLGGSEPGVPTAWRFSTDVAKAWERVVAEAELPATRKVILRSAIVMAPGRGGPFAKLRGLVRLGLGGRAGDGRQFVSWIHGDDFVRAVTHLIERDTISGVVNLAAPAPLPNAEFMRELRRAARAPFGLPAARFMLAAGALVLRTEAELILKSRRVVSRRLADDGFTFHFAEWPDAAMDLCSRARKPESARGRLREVPR